MIPLTRFSSGVMVAHLIPTLYFLIAFAASIVTWSFVLSLCSIPKSKYSIGTLTWGEMSLDQLVWIKWKLQTCFLIISQIILVISSPSISTTGFLTVILLATKHYNKIMIIKPLGAFVNLADLTCTVDLVDFKLKVFKDACIFLYRWQIVLTKETLT